jgi:hypothetical protein
MWRQCRRLKKKKTRTVFYTLIQIDATALRNDGRPRLRNLKCQILGPMASMLLLITWHGTLSILPTLGIRLFFCSKSSAYPNQRIILNVILFDNYCGSCLHKKSILFKDTKIFDVDVCSTYRGIVWLLTAYTNPYLCKKAGAVKTDIIHLKDSGLILSGYNQ